MYTLESMQIKAYAKLIVCICILKTTTTEIPLPIYLQALIELVKKSHYFYYVKFRIGACLPARCSVEDVGKLAQTGE